MQEVSDVCQSHYTVEGTASYFVNLLPLQHICALGRSPFTNTSNPTFVTSCSMTRLCAFKEMGFKHCCSFLVTQREDWYLFRNIQLFQGLTLLAPMWQTVATTSTPTFRQASRTSIKKLANITLSASTNQSWLFLRT